MTHAQAKLDRKERGFHGGPMSGVFPRGFERAWVVERPYAIGLTDVTARTAHTVRKSGPGGDVDYLICLICRQFSAA